jgi:predicted branched-subunit amino acid permease
MMSALVFAGAAHFTAVSMWGQAGGGLIVVTTLMINLRHLLMGASMAPHLKGLPVRWKALLAFGLVDESYALAISRYLRGGAAGSSF